MTAQKWQPQCPVPHITHFISKLILIIITDDNITLVKVMAKCHCLSQCWPRSLISYCIASHNELMALTCSIYWVRNEMNDTVQTTFSDMFVERKFLYHDSSSSKIFFPGCFLMSPINKNAPLALVMAWHQICYNHNLNQWYPGSLTHISVIRLWWVKTHPGLIKMVDTLHTAFPNVFS